MRTTILILIILALVLSLHIGCSDQISLDEALSDEYLSMDPDLYSGRDTRLRMQSEEVLNDLLVAVYKKNNIALVQYYLSIGAKLEQADIDHEEYVDILIENHNSEIYYDLLIESLTNYPDMVLWDLKKQNGTWELALQRFAYNLPAEFFKEVVGYCRDVNHMDKDGDFTLHSLVAAWRNVENKKEKIDILIQAGADPSLITSSGSNILHFFNWWPIEYDYYEFLDLISSSGVDFNKQNKNGDTPLHWAVNPLALKTNSVEYVQYLISHGADIELADHGGLYPVDGLFRYLRGFDSATPEEVSERKEILKLLYDIVDFRGAANPFES